MAGLEKNSAIYGIAYKQECFNEILLYCENGPISCFFSEDAGLSFYLGGTLL